MKSWSKNQRDESALRFNSYAEIKKKLSLSILEEEKKEEALSPNSPSNRFRTLLKNIKEQQYFLYISWIKRQFMMFKLLFNRFFFAKRRARFFKKKRAMQRKIKALQYKKSTSVKKIQKASNQNQFYTKMACQRSMMAQNAAFYCFFDYKKKQPNEDKSMKYRP